MITPTIGRVVWYWPPSRPSVERPSQPQAALVAWVHNIEVVNLAVFDANGKLFSRSWVPLYQGEGDRPEGEYCEWMPYQIGQAARELHPVRVLQPIDVGPQG